MIKSEHGPQHFSGELNRTCTCIEKRGTRRYSNNTSRITQNGSRALTSWHCCTAWCCHSIPLPGPGSRLERVPCPKCASSDRRSLLYCGIRQHVQHRRLSTRAFMTGSSCWSSVYDKTVIRHAILCNFMRSIAKPFFFAEMYGLACTTIHTEILTISGHKRNFYIVIWNSLSFS